MMDRDIESCGLCSNKFEIVFVIGDNQFVNLCLSCHDGLSEVIRDKLNDLEMSQLNIIEEPKTLFEFNECIKEKPEIRTNPINRHERRKFKKTGRI